jgi:hypothetical protein
MDIKELAEVTVPSAVVVAPRVMWYRFIIASLSHWSFTHVTELVNVVWARSGTLKALNVGSGATDAMPFSFQEYDLGHDAQFK